MARVLGMDAMLKAPGAQGRPLRDEACAHQGVEIEPGGAFHFRAMWYDPRHTIMEYTHLRLMTIEKPQIDAGPIGDRLRRFLDFRGKSLRDFERETQIPYRTLQNYLRGERRPGADHLAALAEAGVDLTWLLTGKIRGLRLPDSEGMAEPAEFIGADLELVHGLQDKAFKIADEFQVEYAKEKGTPLPLETILNQADRAFMMLMLVAEHIAPVRDLRSHNVPIETIIDVVSSYVKLETVEQHFTKRGMTEAQVKKLIDLFAAHAAS